MSANTEPQRGSFVAQALLQSFPDKTIREGLVFSVAHAGSARKRDKVMKGISILGAVPFAWFRVFALAVVALGATSQFAQADQLSLIVNGKAVHFEQPSGQKFNERNWGAGIQYDFDRIGESRNWVPFLTASGFKDSFENPSYYAGGGITRRFRFFEREAMPLNIDVGAVAFLMTREDFKNNKPFPGILPVLSFGTDRVSMNITYIPRVDPKMVPLVFMQIKIGLFGSVK